MVYLTLQVEAGAGITYTLSPNEFWAQPSVVSELRTTASWRIERGARRAIRWLFADPKDAPTVIPYRTLFATQDADLVTGDPTRARTQDVRRNVNVTATSERDRDTGEVGNVERCDHCGKDYTRKTTRQRFCSTECRMSYHAARHNGRRFDHHILNGKNLEK
jgi:hypothetical protein